ncbi:MAG: HAD family phosphatase [Anaerolineales bacterium]|nr:HAD family phosphatase [Anaerolineales bacterium]
MTANIKTIIFDFGNVLLEWNPWYVYRRHFDNEDGMKAFFREVDFMAWNAQQDKGRTFKEGVADHAQKFPQYAYLFQAYHDHWKDSIGDAITGTVDILKRLKVKGYPLFGLSNWSAETFPFAREKYDFFDLFDNIIISADVRLVKPEPEIFQLTLEKIGKPAHECVFIDDSLTNIEQAKKIGFVTIHFTSPEQLENKLTQMGIL